MHILKTPLKLLNLLAMLFLSGCYIVPADALEDDADGWVELEAGILVEAEASGRPTGPDNLMYDAHGSCGEPPAPLPCQLHADCPSALACAEGHCAPAPACDDGACSSGVCDPRDTCVEKPDPAACQDDAACSEGTACVQGRCLHDEDTCMLSNECGPGRACLDQACVHRCERSEACPTGLACLGGLCRPDPGATCQFSAQCDEGEQCMAGACRTPCGDQAADSCGEEALCATEGYCAADTAPRPFCSQDRDCAEGHVCAEGVCRTPCPDGSDDQCLRFDSQLSSCGPDLLCHTPSELNPECGAASDCGEGLSCLDAECRVSMPL